MLVWTLFDNIFWEKLIRFYIYCYVKVNVRFFLLMLYLKTKIRSLIILCEIIWKLFFQNMFSMVLICMIYFILIIL